MELALVTSSEYCGKEFPVTEQSDRDESSQVKSLFSDQHWTFSPRFNIKRRYQISRPTRRFSMTQSFNIVEATIDDIHAGYKSGQLTCRQLVKMYLDRIEAFDKKGPAINAIITVNSDALKEADRLDASYKASGPVGPLHGIPVIVKDQADVKGMTTTLG